MSRRTPPLFATGTWTVRHPFEVDTSTIYICKAIRSFDDLEARGIDPYETYYKPLGISREDYDKDVINLANVITLMSDTKPTVYIPDTYISSFPDVTTVPYSHIVLSMSLGAVAETVVLDDLLVKIEELVEASIGIEGKVRVHRAGTVAEGLSQVDHRVIESNRLAKISNNTTTYAKLLEAQGELERVQLQAAELEQIVIENGLLD